MPVKLTLWPGPQLHVLLHPQPVAGANVVIRLQHNLHLLCQCAPIHTPSSFPWLSLWLPEFTFGCLHAGFTFGYAYAEFESPEAAAEVEFE